MESNRIGDKQFCASIYDPQLANLELKHDLDGIHSATYSTLLRSVGTEFKVMQELLRHTTIRSTLDV